MILLIFHDLSPDVIWAGYRGINTCFQVIGQIVMHILPV